MSMHGNRKSGISSRSILWLLFFLMIVQFEALSIFTPKIFTAWKYLSIAAIVVLLSLTDWKIYLNKRIIIGGLFLVVPVFSTLLNGGDAQSLIQITYQTYLCLIMLLGMTAMLSTDGWGRSIEVFCMLFEVLIYVNLISMIIYPNGMMRMVREVNGQETWDILPRSFVRTESTRVAWLLGHQGLLTIYAIPGTCSQVLHDYTVKKKNGFSLRTLAFIAACMIEVFVFSKSANCVLTYGIFLFVLFFYIHNGTWMRQDSFRRRKKLLSPFWIFIMLCVIFMAVVYGNAINIFSFLIVTLLQRDITLTGRMLVWQRSFEAILKKPILGWGRTTAETGFWLFQIAGHPHNQFLFIAWQGGMAALVLFVMFMFYSVKPLSRMGISKYTLVIWTATVTIILGMFGDRYIPYYNICLVMFGLCSHTGLLYTGKELEKKGSP